MSGKRKRIDRLWQGRRDSNTQPMVLETTTLPLSHSPKTSLLYDIFLKLSINFLTFYKNIQINKTLTINNNFLIEILNKFNHFYDIA